MSNNKILFFRIHINGEQKNIQQLSFNNGFDETLETTTFVNQVIINFFRVGDG